MSAATIQRLKLHTLEIPLRGTVAHAGARRAVADPILVQIELIHGVCGIGETLPRPYVTGETRDSVIRDIRREFVPRLLTLRADSFPAALECLDSLPYFASDGHTITAARAAVELALLDAFGKYFSRRLSDIAGWLGTVGLGPPGSVGRVRYSGVLADESLSGCLRKLRTMRWYGLNHFKLKVGGADDIERVRAVAGVMRRRLANGRGSLRLDANGGWSVETAVNRLTSWADLPLAGIEQPLAQGEDDKLQQLRAVTRVPLILDESLVTLEDGLRLIQSGAAGGFNIRISKCGGLLPSLRLAALAHKHGLLVQLGCMVGETGILSAAGIRFLETGPQVVFAEGCFGRFLLTHDICTPSLRFGYGGRIPKLRAFGLGVEPNEESLARFAVAPVEVLEF